MKSATRTRWTERRPSKRGSALGVRGGHPVKVYVSLSGEAGVCCTRGWRVTVTYRGQTQAARGTSGTVARAWEAVNQILREIDAAADGGAS